MTHDELVKEVEILNELLVNNILTCSSIFDACEDECKIQFPSYVDDKRCVKACKVGRDLCK